MVGELAEVVERDDVRMTQPIDRARLAPKPRHELRIQCRLRHQDLQRFFAAGREVLGQPHLAHPATAER